jgi:hypothetical protein
MRNTLEIGDIHRNMQRKFYANMLLDQGELMASHRPCCTRGHNTPQAAQGHGKELFDDFYANRGGKVAPVKPTIGRIVHYVSYGTPNGEYDSVCRAAMIAAIVSQVSEESWFVDLCVMNPTGLFFNTSQQSEEDHKGGTWHWPERDP